MSLNAEVVGTTNQVLDIDSGSSKLQAFHRSDKNYNELSTVMINKSLHFPSKSIEWSIPPGSDPDRGRHPLSLGDCMKMKEIGPRGMVLVTSAPPWIRQYP